jgi:hypothetical protein
VVRLVVLSGRSVVRLCVGEGVTRRTPPGEGEPADASSSDEPVGLFVRPEDEPPLLPPFEALPPVLPPPVPPPARTGMTRPAGGTATGTVVVGSGHVVGGMLGPGTPASAAPRGTVDGGAPV